MWCGISNLLKLKSIITSLEFDSSRVFLLLWNFSLTTCVVPKLELNLTGFLDLLDYGLHSYEIPMNVNAPLQLDFAIDKPYQLVSLRPEVMNGLINYKFNFYE